MTILLFFGGLAALLAALGVYGLISWSVALRTRELAIRLTLGHSPSPSAVVLLAKASCSWRLASRSGLELCGLVTARCKACSLRFHRVTFALP